MKGSTVPVRLVITVLAFLLVAWTALPAVGALLLGWWLRRELRTPDSAWDAV